MSVQNDPKGKVCIVTGANTGIGKAAATKLAEKGAHVFVACRSEEKGKAAVGEIIEKTGNEKVEFLSLDLASLDSVRAAAETFLARDLPIWLLLNNAGLAGQRGTTKDGFELAFGTNHLGHFLFTSLLLDRIKRSEPARIVNVSSKSHYDTKKFDLDAVRQPTRTITGLDEYAVSKLANVFFTQELAKRLEGTKVTVHAVHPGVVASDAWRRIPWPIRAIMKSGMLTNEEGGDRVLYCAFAPELSTETGRYYDDFKRKDPSYLAQDAELQKSLWKKSEEWTGLASPQ